MRWPWFISMSSHEMIVSLLTCQVSDLKREREILLDRLATIGLGGPLFSGPLQQDSSPNTEPEEDQISEEEEHLATIARLKRTPSKLATYMTRYLARDARKPLRGPDVAYIPQAQDPKITAALDAAEALGKKQA